MTSHEIRQKYLNFFAAKPRNHAILPSSSLVPENDPTTLFTGSGMQPMVPFLLGEQHPAGKRLVDSQKCFRSQDIEEVGDNRHTTFFEMLGNWSLGDYFKQEQIPWMFEFLTKELGLDATRLYVTFFKGNAELNIPRDEESAKLWQTCFAAQGIEANIVDDAESKGLQGGRIFSYSEKKNWWSRAGVPSNMPVGEPGGPDTEMFWDFGAERQLHENSTWKDERCHVNCDCGRFLEIGNNVFMEYVKTNDGFQPLPQKNVDFGGGLERMAAAVNNDPDVFNIDLFNNAKFVVETATTIKYGARPEDTVDLRIILDHIRAAIFLIADGILPGKKDRNYLVRRLITRATQRSRHLGWQGFGAFFDIANAFIETYKDAYPELAEKQNIILSAIAEEERSAGLRTIEGSRKLRMIIDKTGKITPQDAFGLYQSAGLSLEVIMEEVKRFGLSIDKDEFEKEFEKHRDISGSGNDKKFAGGLADHSEDTTKLHTATHLLHQALRQVLGDHVEQKGSNITAERLRFDFSHPQKMTPEQIKQVEDIVNEQIKRDLPVHAEQLTIEEAKAKGAIGLFEDKYAQIESASGGGGRINVYFIGDFSREICGGPHVEHTGQLGGIKILKEEASSAGVRRIKAVLGKQE